MRRHTMSTLAVFVGAAATACTTSKVVPATVDTHDHSATVSAPAPQSAAAPAPMVTLRCLELRDGVGSFAAWLGPRPHVVLATPALKITAADW